VPARFPAIPNRQRIKKFWAQFGIFESFGSSGRIFDITAQLWTREERVDSCDGDITFD
jgi:hypothetical protein